MSTKYFKGKVDYTFGDNILIDFDGTSIYGVYAKDNSFKNMYLINIQYRVNNSNNTIFEFDGVSSVKSNINISNSKLKGGILMYSITFLEMNL